MSSAPVVAHAAPNGLLGKSILPIFVAATQAGTFSHLKLITRSETDASRKAVADGAGKIEAYIVSYDDKAILSACLKGVDVLISTMGSQGEAGAAAQMLIEAAVEAGVKVYFPSAFGHDYEPTTFDSPLLEGKMAHVVAAQRLGLHTVFMSTSAFIQAAFATPYFGVEGHTWNIQGDGNTPFAVTDIGDIGRYLVRAVILAFQDPVNFPSRLRVYSDMRTWNEYFDIAKDSSPKPIKRVYVPREELLMRYKSGKESPYFVLRVAMNTPANDFTGSTDNELLNPGQKYFKPVAYEDYIKTM